MRAAGVSSAISAAPRCTALDTRQAPFDSLLARRAAATAVDRSAAAAALGKPARPSCQILPPVLVGYRPSCPYGVGPGSSVRIPDLGAARQLVRRPGTSASSITLAAPDEWRTLAQLIARRLRGIGYMVHLTVEPDDSVYYSMISDPGQLPDAHLSRAADLPSASSFAALAQCASVGPGGLNTSGYCDHESDQLISRALRLQMIAPDRTAAAWQRVDHRLSETLPWIPLASLQGAVFASRSVTTLVQMPLLGLAFERITVTPP